MSVQQKINSGAYKNDLPYGPDAATRNAWRASESMQVAQFWADVEEEFDSKRFHPIQWSKLCSLAWDYGHSSGLSEVLSYVEELVSLLEAALT